MKQVNIMNTVGETYRDFRLERISHIEELDVNLREIVHEPTGAQVIHIDYPDPENVFCISFKTLPENSNGVAHILEHTVLCGSEKYPVKDPFFFMQRRSLNTFMNAFTGNDFTAYTASSQIPEDFYNLFDVYLDATFFPLLKKESFLQEGIRVELSDPADLQSPLKYHGIVFNEMKGSMFKAERRLDEYMLQSLLPDLPYQYNSGGDPKVIPSLTYEELKEFHAKFYHPSQALFFFCGDLPLQKHLDVISERVLDKTTSKAAPVKIPLQTRFTEPKYIEKHYPIGKDDPTEGKDLIGISWLTCPIQDQLESLALEVLGIALLDTDASPVKKALLSSKLCAQIDWQLQATMSEVPLSLMLRGVEKKNLEKIEQIIDSCLKELVAGALTQETLERALHQVQLMRTEINSQSEPFGLQLYFRCGLNKQHGADCAAALRFCDSFKQLKEKGLSYFQALIEKYLIHNPHRTTAVLLPSSDVLENEEKEEVEQLQKLKSQLTEAGIQAIVAETHHLEEFQKEQEQEGKENVLPKISLSSIPKEVQHIDLEKTSKGDARVFYHEAFTNKMIYLDCSFPLVGFKEEDLPWVSLFGFFLTEIGMGHRNYIEALKYIQGSTGGVSADISLHTSCENTEQMFPKLTISTKALSHKVEALFEILKDLIQSPDFTSRERLKELIAQHVVELEESLSHNALRHAIDISGASISQATRLHQLCNGVEYITFVRDLLKDWENRCFECITKCSSLAKQILRQKKMDLVITCDPSTYEEVIQNQFFGLFDIALTEDGTWESLQLPESSPYQALLIPSPVAFTVQQLKSLPYTHVDAPLLSLASYIMTNTILHPQIREQGGAYGGGARNRTSTGLFYLYAYRDPNLAETLVAFREAIESIADGEFDEQDLEEAKLEMIQDIDAPIAPGSKGYTAYEWKIEGKTPEIRMQFKQRILMASIEEVRVAVKKHLLEKYEAQKTASCVGEDLLHRENEKLDNSFTTISL